MQVSTTLVRHCIMTLYSIDIVLASVLFNSCICFIKKQPCECIAVGIKFTKSQTNIRKVHKTTNKHSETISFRYISTPHYCATFSTPFAQRERFYFIVEVLKQVRKWPLRPKIHIKTLGHMLVQ